MGDVKGVVLVFRDATEQRVAELTARKLTSIIENSNDAIYTTDLNTVITSWNRGAEIIFGYSAREAIGQSTSFFIPQERAAEEFKILERLRHAERIDHYETVRRQKNGL
jgi:PAS domain S-box-containing protein